MLTKLRIRNFKKFDEAEIELGNPVVFVGPNNSGKTTALQALALWHLGLNRWLEKRKDKTVPQKRPAVTINRKDLIPLPVPTANLLWKNLHVRSVRTVEGNRQTGNIRIDITVEGVTGGTAWACGLEFDYANSESFYCRPLRLTDEKNADCMPIAEPAETITIAYLPPMSGLAANETRLDAGAINVRIGEARTAEVLRNLCWIVSKNEGLWTRLTDLVGRLFGCELQPPEYIKERGEVVMGYTERGARLDLSSSGRGMQQTLLLFVYMFANPGAVVLIDEPDAPLEILRQRQIYQTLTDEALKNGNQIIIASHSEILLNEAASRNVAVAFLGKPHLITDRRGSQVLKSLKEIGFEHYQQAEQTGWVLYLEGSTDLAILRSFAEKLGHSGAMEALERPYVHYVGNDLNEVRKHFFGLKEALPHLQGIALFDRLSPLPPESTGACLVTWRKREIENFLCYPQVLEAYAASMVEDLDPLFQQAEAEKCVAAMRQVIKELTVSMDDFAKGGPWDEDTKVSDDFLTPVFRKFYKLRGTYNLMEKSNFHELARFVSRERIDPEVVEKLDAIAATAQSAVSGECLYK